MPATYSINVGQPTEAFRKQDINSVMLDLPDNTQKLISPKDVRDAFLTAWANSAFKQTIGQANIEYLGIDSGNPSNRDIKQKIYIGKRNFAGSDIMTSSLLNDVNSDIYIYNTKPDNYSTQSTSIVILSGTDSFLHQNAPYIHSNVVNGGSALSLDFVNPSLYSGPINVFSSTGRVAINGIMFPTVAETSASASNGKILKYFGTYPNGVLRWSDATVSISSVGSLGFPTNIYGSPSNVNGYSLEFVNSSVVPQTIGGVVQGSSFSAGSFNGQNWPLSEVIRRILYPYVPPGLSLSVSVNNVNYLSTGLTQSSVFNYSVTRYSNVISSYNISGGSPTGTVGTYSGLSFSGNVGSSINATFSFNLFSNSSGTQSYVLSARDNPFLITFSHSATASIRFLHPMFSGFSSTAIDLYTTGGPAATLRASQTGAIMNSSLRFVQPYLGPSQSISTPLSGSGYIYFMIPFLDYPLLSSIKDPNGFMIHDSSFLNISAFTYSTAQIIPTGANNLPSVAYRVYRTVATCSYTGTGNFQLIF
jgi:hypothetical protein